MRSKLLKALAADVNQGYQGISNWVVDMVNGEKIWNMHDLVERIENCEELFVILEDEYHRRLIIDKAKAEESQQEILEIYRIPSDRSEDLG